MRTLSGSNGSRVLREVSRLPSYVQLFRDVEGSSVDLRNDAAAPILLTDGHSSCYLHSAMILPSSRTHAQIVSRHTWCCPHSRPANFGWCLDRTLSIPAPCSARSSAPAWATLLHTVTRHSRAVAGSASRNRRLCVPSMVPIA
ncbi:unnamed protein product [Mycena citricolor]|uniref:Uncharacterized protein n=1 Tax=Mycena citricolor TaxID=2018698 RepID=A0AAD2K7G9_9AGAR|nr:unnamed protein product [Mycena citricolor]